MAGQFDYQLCYAKINNMYLRLVLLRKVSVLSAVNLACQLEQFGYCNVSLSDSLAGGLGLLGLDSGYSMHRPSRNNKLMIIDNMQTIKIYNNIDNNQTI